MTCGFDLLVWGGGEKGEGEMFRESAWVGVCVCDRMTVSESGFIVAVVVFLIYPLQQTQDLTQSRSSLDVFDLQSTTCRWGAATGSHFPIRSGSRFCLEWAMSARCHWKGAASGLSLVRLPLACEARRVLNAFPNLSSSSSSPTPACVICCCTRRCVCTINTLAIPRTRLLA